MGQAKRRGSLEDRMKNPNPKKTYLPLSEEDMKKLMEEVDKMFMSVKKSLFGPSKPKKIKQKQIKTGG